MSQLGVEVKKGAKNEIALQNPSVGELQFVGVEHEVFVEQEIEVNHPWTVFPDDLLAESCSVSCSLVSNSLGERVVRIRAAALTKEG